MSAEPVGVGAATYAQCVTCGIDLPTPAIRDAHTRETFNASPGPLHRSHSTQTVNPTPEEAERSRLRYIVADAVDRAVGDFIERVERAVDRGEITAEQVAEELRSYPDFADGWDEFMAEAGS